METFVVFLLGVVVGAFAAVFVWPFLRPKPGGPRPAAGRCEGLVQLSVTGGKIQALPPNVCLHPDRELSWEIDGPGEVEIEFEVKNGKKGPFPHDGANPHNEGRGKYRRPSGGNPRVRSNSADTTGPWKYTVTWKLAGGPQIPPLDPVVCIRGDN